MLTFSRSTELWAVFKICYDTFPQKITNLAKIFYIFIFFFYYCTFITLYFAFSYLGIKLQKTSYHCWLFFFLNNDWRNGKSDFFLSSEQHNKSLKKKNPLLKSRTNTIMLNWNIKIIFVVTTSTSENPGNGKSVHKIIWNITVEIIWYLEGFMRNVWVYY